MAVEDRGSSGLMGKEVGRHTDHRSPPYGMEGLPSVLVFLAHPSLCVCVLPVYLKMGGRLHFDKPGELLALIQNNFR